MKKAILGEKVGMTQIFSQDGKVIPVTVVEAGPCVVLQKKTEEHDGYASIQVGFKDIREKLVNKPDKARFQKVNVPCKRYVKEFRFEDSDSYQVGQEIRSDIFSSGDHIDVSGVSKGKGFAGVIKRWNQSRGPMEHGSRYHRRPGSMSSNTDPARVFKNKKLAGHLGHENVTIMNLEVVRVDPEKNLILVKGALPGANGSLVYIKETVKSGK